MPVLRVTDLAWGGEGLGRLEGKVVFVPFALPGEVIEVDLLESKRDYCRGKLIRVLEPSPKRVLPPCPYFGECGGCQLQHLAFSQQAKEKERLFKQVMAHGLKNQDIEFHPILESPLAFGYRHRLNLKGTRQGGRYRLGFFKSRSHEVIPVQQCLLGNLGLNRFLTAFFEKSGKGEVSFWPAELEVQMLEDSLEGTLFFPGHGLPSPKTRRELNSLFGDLPGLRGVFFPDPEKKVLIGENPFFPPAHALRYRLPAEETGLVQDLRMACFPSVFSQVNLTLNRFLISGLLARRLCGPSDRLLDLFCGQGNLSLPFSFQVREVVGMEALELAVENACWNRSRNGIRNCNFIGARAGEGLALLKKKGFQADMIIMDPPRSGVRELIPILAGFKATRILYLSCDPLTLVRDLGLFQRQGWKIAWSQPVDFFPQTYHLESVTFLEYCPPT